MPEFVCIAVPHYIGQLITRFTTMSQGYDHLIAVLKAKKDKLDRASTKKTNRRDTP